MADEKYSAPAELPRYPTIIRDAANAAGGAAAAEAPAPGAVIPGDDNAPPPPRFPSMVDVALPRADAVARANALEQQEAAEAAEMKTERERRGADEIYEEYEEEDEEEEEVVDEVEDEDEVGEMARSGSGGAAVGAFGGRRVASGEIGESLRKNVVKEGSGERKAREAGEKVWGKREQEDFDTLVSTHHDNARGPVVPNDGDSSWIGGASLTKVVREQDAAAHHNSNAPSGVYEGAPLRDSLSSRVVGEEDDEQVEEEEEVEEEIQEERMLADDVVIEEDDEVVVDEEEEKEEDDDREDQTRANAALMATGSLATGGALAAAASSKPQGDLLKRKSLASSVEIPASAVRTDQTLSTGDDSWIGGGVALTKAQLAEKEAEEAASFGRDALVATERRGKGALGEEMSEVDQLGREDDSQPEWVHKSRHLKSATPAEDAGVREVADGSYADTTTLASSERDQDRALGGDFNAFNEARLQAPQEAVVEEEEEEEEPEWVRKARELKAVDSNSQMGSAGVAAGVGTGLAAAAVAADHADDRYEDEQPEWVRNRPVLAPAGSGALADVSDNSSTPLTPAATEPTDSMLESATGDADRAADIGASYEGNRISSTLLASSADAGTATDMGPSYAGDRINSGLVASSADAGTSFDRRESSSSSTAAAAGVAGTAGIIGAGGYSAMTRDSYTSQRSSSDSFATATGSVLTGAPPAPSSVTGQPVNTNPGAIGLANEPNKLLSGSSYSDLGAPEAVARVPSADVQEEANAGHSDLLFSGPTSAPPPRGNDSWKDEEEQEDDGRGIGAAGATAAAVGGVGVGAAAAGVAAATTSSTSRGYGADGVGMRASAAPPRVPAVTSVPVTQTQGRPVLSGQWADEDVDEAGADEDVAARHAALSAGDPGINGAHVNVTRDFGLFGGHAEGVNDAAFVDSETLLTAGQDGKVCVWDISNRFPKSEFVPYEGKPVTMLHVLPPDEETNSWTIMTLSEDRLMRIWNTTLERAVLLHSTQIPASKNDVVVSIPAISAKKRERATAAAKAAAEAEAAQNVAQDAVDDAEEEGKKEAANSGGMFSSFGLFNRRKDAVPA